jgi:membrane protein involved in colicin uptake
LRRTYSLLVRATTPNRYAPARPAPALGSYVSPIRSLSKLDTSGAEARARAAAAAEQAALEQAAADQAEAEQAAWEQAEAAAKRAAEAVQAAELGGSHAGGASPRPGAGAVRRLHGAAIPTGSRLPNHRGAGCSIEWGGA